MIAGSGLRASNASLNTTANNISNVQTEGYSRQEVVQQAASALQVFSTYGCAGAGVETLAIERIRDSFYDVKYRENETKLGEYDSKAYYTTILEDYLTDDGITGFSSIFDQITNALEEITKDASSTSTKANFLSTLQSLTDYFNNMYGDLQELQADLNDEVKVRTDQINSIAQQIATLNKQINVIEMTGTVANELRDQRDALVDQLSGIVSVDVTETPIYDSAGNETGATRYIVKIAGGQLLVDQNDYRTLTCVARSSDEKVNQSDIDGLYDIYWSDGVEFGLTNSTMGGQLMGLLQMRDGNNSQYFNGTVSSMTYNRTTSTVTIATTASYLASMSSCTLPEEGKITIGNQVFYYTSWSYDDDGNYTFVIDNEKSDQPLLNGATGKEASVGAAVAYEGIPYYLEQMNEWIREFSAALNAIFTEGVTSESLDAGIVLSANYATVLGQYTEDELNDSAGDGKGYYYITAGNFSVVEELLNSPDLLGTRYDPTAGVEECEQVTKVLSMFADTNQFSFRGRTAGGFLECILSDVALNASNADTFYTMYASLSTSIDNQRTSISGVDEDEETVNLVKYQQAYSLSSKMITVLTEIYDRLILETGV